MDVFDHLLDGVDPVEVTGGDAHTESAFDGDDQVIKVERVEAGFGEGSGLADLGEIGRRVKRGEQLADLATTDLGIGRKDRGLGHEIPPEWYEVLKK
jgi:hypothetical protein